MAILALDLGRRVTGVAYFDASVGFPFPLDPIEGGETTTVAAVLQLAKDRRVTTLVIGMPFLPDGSEGGQAIHTRNLAEQWERAGLTIHFLDERYTSKTEHSEHDSHAKAAVALLQMALDRGLVK